MTRLSHRRAHDTFRCRARALRPFADERASFPATKADAKRSSRLLGQCGCADCHNVVSRTDMRSTPPCSSPPSVALRPRVAARSSIGGASWPAPRAASGFSVDGFGVRASVGRVAANPSRFASFAPGMNRSCRWCPPNTRSTVGAVIAPGLGSDVAHLAGSERRLAPQRHKKLLCVSVERM